ncbi:MAG: YecA family protein [Pseudomonadales bacterium]|jgi:yecA family protein|nr:YecA family protein [Pseudomonadales bacterium]
MDFSEKIEFDDLQNRLMHTEVLQSPSELHGLVSGMLCCRPELETERLLADLWTQLDLDPVELHEVDGILRLLFDDIRAALNDTDFIFYPLLPGDDEDLSWRTECLGGWCQGFLSGFGLGTDPDKGPLDNESGEILRNFYEFTKVSSVYDDEDIEELEADYFELVEFLKVTVIHLYLDETE